MAPTPLLVRLNRETVVHHADADATWHSLLVLDVRRDDYIDQLIRVYGFEAPLEGALAYAPEMDTVERREQARSGRIVEDLLVLGMRPGQIAQLAQCPDITPFADPLHALGWLYALERATMIHGMLRRHLISRFPEIVRATTYLAAGEGSMGERLRDLGAVLERVVTSAESENSVLVGAHMALASQRRWFGQPAHQQLDVGS
ncbi:MAG TPA: biliverdin-producing heme oxygenase [Kofleriaceae bacterium]|nr:biliverdin-producing heme oxygenase [Kofleriaceae bacterium]